MSTRREIFMAAVQRAWDHPTLSETGKMAAIILAFETSKMQSDAYQLDAPASESQLERRTKMLGNIILAFKVIARMWAMALPVKAHVLQKMLDLGLAIINRSPSGLRLAMAWFVEQKGKWNDSLVEIYMENMFQIANGWSEPISFRTSHSLSQIESSTDDAPDWELMRELIRIAKDAGVQ